MFLVWLLACPTPFHGDDTSGDADADTDADADADTGFDFEEDDARVQALTDLPEGDDAAFPPLLVRINYVVDGDTFYCTPVGTSESLKVRMIGIDTPETAHDDPAECYGNEAWAYTEGELTNRLAWLTYDADPDDSYGRSLNYVIRGSDQDGFFNRNLARHGYATPLTVDPNDAFENEIQADADAAEADDVGLWAACGA